MPPLNLIWEVMNNPLAIILLVAAVGSVFSFIAALSVRSILSISADYRQQKYHKLTDDEVDKITSATTPCRFAHGLSGPGLDKKATIHIDSTSVVIIHPDKQTERLKLVDIARVECPDPGTLYILPKNLKAIAIKDDGRWGVYFGDHWAVRSYGTLPFKWQYKAHQAWEADRLAVAFYLRIIRALDKS